MSLTAGKYVWATMCGAAIVPAAERSFCRSIQPSPFIEPISRTVVTPCASHSL